ncbi:hypothetical protein BHK98_10880 [Hornefia porci]|uniref:Uncharacterized protein n=1 Tax=Hornefia porci TaxID=2652292 RepID=A0A1Q9JJY8_9FIRM|nr:hypothetical protein BHK98_10880 [Hornefia porci]
MTKSQFDVTIILREGGGIRKKRRVGRQADGRSHVVDKKRRTEAHGIQSADSGKTRCIATDGRLIRIRRK